MCPKAKILENLKMENHSWYLLIILIL
jgi:hypothetical protein